MHVQHVTDDSFEKEVLENPKPVLLDFWAEWCGPCKMLSPVLDEIAKKYSDRICVAKMDIDDNHHTPAKYGVRGIPTLLIIKNGEIVASKVGALSSSQVAAFIEGNI